MPRSPIPGGRKSLRLFAIAAIVIGGLWWWAGPPLDPVYHGQRLSERFADVAYRNGDSYLFAGELRVYYGAAAVPWLVGVLDTPPFTGREPQPFKAAPGWLREKLPQKWGGFRPSVSSVDIMRAAWALAELGPTAAPAIPALARCLERTENTPMPHVDEWSARALQRIGPASWPAVQQLLKRGNPRTRYLLVCGLEDRLGSIAQPAPGAEVANTLAALVHACSDPDPSVRSGAACVIASCLRRRPDLRSFDTAIPELVPFLSTANHYVRQAVASAIVHRHDPATPVASRPTAMPGDEFRPQADYSPADVPRLVAMLDDPEGRVRAAAATVLGAVDTAEKRSVSRLRAMLRDDPVPYCRSSAGDALIGLGLSPGGEDAPRVPGLLPLEQFK